MDKKLTGIFAYIGIIFWLIAYLAGDKEGAKFHLNQGLLLILISIANSILSVIPIISVVSWFISIALLVFMIMGIIAAAKDEEKPLPVIGGIQILK